jgi:uncharacterized membrane protein YkvA (DUF1232 family)
MGRPAESSDALPIPDRFVEQASRPDVEVTLRERLPGKLRRLADGRLVSLAKEAYGYATHPAIGRRHKVLGAAALLYLIAPMDAVADWIPGLGYVDDAAVLTAFVMSVRNAAKEVVDHTQQAASEVVSQAISEARESWARRGVSQVCLSLWAATLAACVGMLYTGAKATLFGTRPLTTDPFLWACLAVGALGLAYEFVFAGRVWARYSRASPEIREPLAHAIVSLADWRQALALALPVVALLALAVVRGVLFVQANG